MISFITRTITAIFMVVILFTAFAPISLAQGNSGRVDDDVYTVETGDTLYTLAGTFRNDPETWREVVEANPFLREKGRVFDRAGRTIVLIRPGERLIGLGRLGIIAEPVSIDRLVIPESVIPTPTPVVVDNSWPLWAWVLIILLALVLIALAVMIFAIVTGNNAAKRLGIHVTDVDTEDLRIPQGAPNSIAQTLTPRTPLQAFEQTVIRQAVPASVGAQPDGSYVDPITAGPAMVEGGLTDANAGPEILSRVYAEHPDMAATFNRPFRIIRLTSGYITRGTFTTYYQGRQMAQTIVDPARPIRAYRALVVLPDGTEQERYALQGCGNDITYGDRFYTPGPEFTFVEGHEILVPEPMHHVVVVSTEPVSAEEIDLTPLLEEEQGELLPDGVLTTENFFEQMVRLGVFTEQDVQRAQSAQSEPSHIIAVDGDRVTVNGVTFIDATGISLRDGVSVILPMFGETRASQLYVDELGRISGFPPTAQKSQTTNGGGSDTDDDLAMATVS